MSRLSITENVQRRLYAESMGRCMNPACKKELFCQRGDIIEKAHIDPYCKTADNSFENLVILCPNCHTNFDKNSAFTPEEVLIWKQLRQQELESFFGIKYNTFQELKSVVVPLLSENKTIFENYYLCENKALWDTFEPIVLINNRKLKTLLSNNRDLFQTNPTKEYSNVECVNAFILHIDEFERTRGSDEKIRQALFPDKINSIFGISPVNEDLIPATESLEALMVALIDQGQFGGITLGVENPYFIMKESDEKRTVYLKDTPQLRQLYYDYNCFRKGKVRLNSLNFALKYIRSRNIRFSFVSSDSLREIVIANTKIIFVYEYCLSDIALRTMCPEKGSVIVNLHNWNGEGCISNAAYKTSEQMGITLLTMDAFYGYIEELAQQTC